MDGMKELQGERESVLGGASLEGSVLEHFGYPKNSRKSDRDQRTNRATQLPPTPDVLITAHLKL